MNSNNPGRTIGVSPTVGGARLYLEQHGRSDSPPVVLIHGFAGSRRWWHQLLPHLADRYRLLCLDLPGHGLSDEPVDGYAISARADQVATTLLGLGVQHAIVIAHSSGGFVATELAAQHRSLVSALVLINTGTDPDAYIAPNPLLTSVLHSPVSGPLLWRARTDKAILRSMRSAFAPGFAIPHDVVDDVRRLSHHTFVATGRENLKYIGQQHLPDRLAVLTIPMLILFGALDRRWRVSHVERYKKVPSATVTLVPTAGHTPMIETPELTAHYAHMFLESVGR
jgi:pimeloyl-ACP methyl ester carboxylesterase